MYIINNGFATTQPKQSGQISKFGQNFTSDRKVFNFL